MLDVERQFVEDAAVRDWRLCYLHERIHQNWLACAHTVYDTPSTVDDA